MLLNLLFLEFHVVLDGLSCQVVESPLPSVPSTRDAPRSCFDLVAGASSSACTTIPVDR